MASEAKWPVIQTAAGKKLEQNTTINSRLQPPSTLNASSVPHQARERRHTDSISIKENPLNSGEAYNMEEAIDLG